MLSFKEWQKITDTGDDHGHGTALFIESMSECTVWFQLALKTNLWQVLCCALLQVRAMELNHNTFLLKLIELWSWVALQSLFYWAFLCSLFSLYPLCLFYQRMAFIPPFLFHGKTPLLCPSQSYPPFTIEALSPPGSFPLPLLAGLCSVPLWWVCIHGWGQS